LELWEVNKKSIYSDGQMKERKRTTQQRKGASNIPGLGSSQNPSGTFLPLLVQEEAPERGLPGLIRKVVYYNP
jgi:hypothetical protein